MTSSSSILQAAPHQSGQPKTSRSSFGAFLSRHGWRQRPCSTPARQLELDADTSSTRLISPTTRD